MGKTKTKSRSVGDSPKPPITIRSTNPKVIDDNIAKLEKAIQASDVSANPSGTAEETLLSSIGIDGKKYDLGPSAENTSYDNTNSGLTADDVQAAIDEISIKCDTLSDNNYFKPGDTFGTGWLPLMGITNSNATSFDGLLSLPKAIRSDVQSITVSGTVDGVRTNGQVFSTNLTLSGNINSLDGLLYIQVTGDFGTSYMMAGVMLITGFRVTFN